MPEQAIDIHILFKSFFKKIGPMTLKAIKDQKDKDRKKEAKNAVPSQPI